MDAVIDEVVSPEDLKRFEKNYNDQLRQGPVSGAAQFEYAWCLIRSKYTNDVKRGLALLEDLYQKTPDDEARRDYLFYLAVGNARLKEYSAALKYTKAILQVEPKNNQVQQLKQTIDSRMKKEGLIGMAIVGGAAVAVVGGLLGVGIALAKK